MNNGRLSGGEKLCVLLEGLYNGLAVFGAIGIFKGFISGRARFMAGWFEGMGVGGLSLEGEIVSFFATLKLSSGVFNF